VHGCGEKGGAGLVDRSLCRSGARAIPRPRSNELSLVCVAAGGSDRDWVVIGRYHEDRLRLRLLRLRPRRLFESSDKVPGNSMSNRRAARMTRNATASIETTTPARASARHQPSARSKAQTESNVDRTRHPNTTIRSAVDVANPHQPRTITSIASAPVPAQAIANPATAGMSNDRPNGRSGLMMYDMFVILRASMTICDGAGGGRKQQSEPILIIQPPPRSLLGSGMCCE